MSQPVTVRLPDPAAEEQRQIAQRERRSVSEVGARMIEEGLRQSHFPYIEFRSFHGERHACIKGRLQVWQLIMVAQHYGMDVEKVADHLDLKPEPVQAGFHYIRSVSGGDRLRDRGQPLLHFREAQAASYEHESGRGSA